MAAFRIEEFFAYPAPFLYELVTDVAQYPTFLPWCLHADVLEKTEHMLIADLTVGMGLFKDTFRSRVLLTPCSRVEVVYEKGPLKHLKNLWIFREDPDGTYVSFEVDFAFHSPLLNKMMEHAFPKAVQKMILSFKNRAQELYSKVERKG